MLTVEGGDHGSYASGWFSPVNVKLQKKKNLSGQRGFSSFLQPLILMHLPLSLEF